MGDGEEEGGMGKERKRGGRDGGRRGRERVRDGERRGRGGTRDHPISRINRVLQRAKTK